MRTYLFSSIAGSFVFDREFRILFDAPVLPDALVETAGKLSKGEWLAAEERLAQQYGRELAVVGFKKDARGHELTQDARVMGKIRGALRGRLYDFQAANVLVAKMGVRSALTPDDLILQCSRSIREQDNAFNMLVSRLREWYELYNPEPSKKLQDHAEFVDAILQKGKEELLAQCGVKESETMGAQLSKEDVDAILSLARTAKSVLQAREKAMAYLASVTEARCPNMAKVATPFIAAELIAIAGSLERIACMPSSTVQLLGAEKALFKHLRNRKVKPPKHGVIVNHPFMAKVPAQKRGRLARLLADKISVASRIDFFKGEFRGDALLKQVEEAMQK